MPEAALIRLGERTHYVPGAVNVGVIETPDGGAVLVDSGADAEHAKRILRACRAAGLEPRAILNTHAHADHAGGNALLQSRLGIPAHAPAHEDATLRYPMLEPIALYHGARPPRELQGKWLLAQASTCHATTAAGTHSIAGIDVELIDTPGHAHAHHAVLVDDVLFAADAAFGPAVLEKYPLQYAVDTARQRQSIHAIAATAARVVVPGHGEPTTDAAALARANIDALERAANAVLHACTTAATLADVLERSCATLGVTITDLARYCLNETAVLAHLTELLERGEIEATVRDNRLTWTALE